MEIPLAKPHLVPCHSLMYNEGHLKVCHDSTWAEHFIVFFLSEDPGESFHFHLAAAVELPGFWEVSSGFSCLGLANWSELSSQPTCHTLSGVDPSILMCCCLARVSFVEEMATQLALSCLSSMLNAFSTIVVLKRFFFSFLHYVWLGVCTGQKRALGPLGLELHMVVSHLMWVLGTALATPVRATCALKGELSLQPHSFLSLSTYCFCF